AAAGMATVAVGYRYGIPPVAAGLFLFGYSSGTWDVGMNVQGAAVEHVLGRAIMSRFHAGWSVGTVAGAGTGTAMVALGVPVTVLGSLTFALFLVAMTAGRWFGPAFIDRYGRVPVLRVCAATALAGLLLIEVGGLLLAALAGAVLLGLGTSQGFPVGISAAADDPRYAPGRVSTVASIGYVAFLAGPPAIGFLADHVGVLRGLSVTGVLFVVAFMLCPI